MLFSFLLLSLLLIRSISHPLVLPSFRQHTKNALWEIQRERDRGGWYSIKFFCISTGKHDRHSKKKICQRKCRATKNTYIHTIKWIEREKERRNEERKRERESEWEKHIISFSSFRFYFFNFLDIVVLLLILNCHRRYFGGCACVYSCRLRSHRSSSPSLLPCSCVSHSKSVSI